METTFSANDVRVGDVVAYPAIERARGRKPFRPARDDRDWLKVTRVDKGFIYGTRVHPDEWERELEYAIYPLQITENGVVIAAGVCEEER